MSTALTSKPSPTPRGSKTGRSKLRNPQPQKTRSKRIPRLRSGVDSEQQQPPLSIEGRETDFLIMGSGLWAYKARFRVLPFPHWPGFVVNHKLPAFLPPFPPATTIMRRGGARAALDLVAILIAAAAVFVVVDCSNGDPQLRCSRTCVAQNCDSVGIRYGKYCGVGWSGCPGEKPCDDLDACCQVHDECVEKKGMTNIKCHERFKTCIKKVQKSGKVGFSRDCPYQTAVPTMVQGMDMAILLSQFGNSKLEL